MRRILTLAALAATVLFSGMNLAVSAADNLPVTVDINGEAVTFDSQPQIMNDRVMVPMRAIFEKLGCYVFWDNDSKTAKGVRNGHVVSIVVGDKNAYVDSQRKELDQPAVITAEERILVPLRFVSEALGAEVEWNGDQRNVSITAEFGMVYRTPTGLVRPQICAPIFGTDSSRFKAGDTYEFSYRIINQFDTWYNTYKHVVRDLYNVKDLRTNYFTSLNEAIYNATSLASML